MMYLSDLMMPLEADLYGEDCRIERVSTDTRDIRSGDLFVALRGEHYDGHNFAAEAATKGAVAVLVNRRQTSLTVPQLVVRDTQKGLGHIAAYWRKQFKGRVIGVTGSSGKTSVKGMLRDILALEGSVVATQGNLNNQIGVPLSVLRLRDEAFAVIEMGTNKPGEIAYLTSVAEPDIALVNNVMPAHIGGFGSLSAIAAEKSAIYGRLREDQVAIINLDDRFAQQFIAQTHRCQQWGFSLSDEPQQMPTVHASSLHWDTSGRAAFVMHYGDQQLPIQLAVPGQHNVNNALAAAACALAADCSLANIAAGLAQFGGEPGRMQILAGPRGTKLVDDTYNANPGSVTAAIDYLSERSGTRILILGDLGELGFEAPEFHRQLGRYARQKNISALYTCGPLSRLCAEAFGDRARSFDDHLSLVEFVSPLLSADTTVLVKGSRSARMDQVVKMLYQSGEQRPC